MRKTEIVCRVTNILLALFVWAVTGSAEVLADESTGQDFKAFREKEAGDLESRFAGISAVASNAPLSEAARQVVTDVDTIVSEVMSSLDRVRATAVGGMVGEAIGVSSKKPAKVVIPSQADQVRSLYGKYHDRLAKAAVTTETDSPQARVVRQYIDAVLTAAEKYILAHAGKLDALDDETAVGAEWAILMPMLIRKDTAWSKEYVDGFPGWLKRIPSLRAAEYVCLSSGRPKVAYILWGEQIPGDQGASLGLDSYLANLHRRANAYFGSKDFLRGIAVLKAAVLLAEQEGLTDEAVKTHFRLAEVYTMYGHSQLAADEMKLVITTYSNHPEHGRAVLTRMKYLYESGRIDTILDEAPAALEDKAASSYRPQIIYIAWVANRRQDNKGAAEDLQQRLIREYPDHPLCADMHFATAMNLLAAGDYAGASRLLEMISERYGKTPIAVKSRDILSRIEAQKPQTSTTTTSPGGG